MCTGTSKSSAGTIRRKDRNRKEHFSQDSLVSFVSLCAFSKELAHPNFPLPWPVLVPSAGIAEIRAMHGRLVSTRQFRHHWVLPLHSSISPAEQRQVFKVGSQGMLAVGYVVATESVMS